MTFKRILPVFSIVLFASACAHSSREITAEARSEPVTNAPGALKDRMVDLIQNDPNVTESQRASLLALSDRVSAEQAASRQLLNQKKSLLMKEILSPNYDVKRANTIAKSIRNLYDKQLHTTINAMQEAKTILNRLQNREVFMNRLMDNAGRW
jgi:hypothetical protein